MNLSLLIGLRLFLLSIINESFLLPCTPCNSIIATTDCETQGDVKDSDIVEFPCPSHGDGVEYHERYEILETLFCRVWHDLLIPSTHRASQNEYLQECAAHSLQMMTLTI